MLKSESNVHSRTQARSCRSFGRNRAPKLYLPFQETHHTSRIDPHSIPKRIPYSDLRIVLTGIFCRSTTFPRVPHRAFARCFRGRGREQGIPRRVLADSPPSEAKAEKAKRSSNEVRQDKVNFFPFPLPRSHYLGVNARNVRHLPKPPPSNQNTSYPILARLNPFPEGSLKPSFTYSQPPIPHPPITIPSNTRQIPSPKNLFY